MTSFHVKIENFGPISKGSLEIKPMTIFIGTNNTGKSYSAMLIHTFLESLSAFYRRAHPSTFFLFEEDSLLRRERVRRSSRYSQSFDVIFSKDILDKLNNEISIKLEDSDSLQISKDLTNEIFDVCSNQINTGFSNLFTNELKRNFGCEVSELCTNSSPLKLFFKMRGMEYHYNCTKKNIISSNIKITYEGIIVKITGAYPEYRKATIKDNFINIIYPESFYGISMRRSSSKIGQQLWRSEYRHYLNNILIEYIKRGLIPDVLSSSYYLPAARSGILSGHKALASGVFRQLPWVGITEMGIPLLTGTIADFLANIIEMRKRPIKYGIEVNFLEKKIIEGSVDIVEMEKFTYPDIHYIMDKKEMPLHRASSMVQELAPLILYVKYILNRNNYLVIEEPESHLHPNAQRNIARGLVRLVNKEINVIITTHSDYMLKQIQNLCFINNLGFEFAKKLKYAKRDMLNSDLLTVYLFSKNKLDRTTEITKIDISDTSIYKTGFPKVTDALYEESVKIERALLKEE